MIEATSGSEIVARVRVTVRTLGWPDRPALPEGRVRPCGPAPAPVGELAPAEWLACAGGEATRSVTSVSGGPLTRLVASSSRQAREAAAVDRHDHVFGAQTRARGGGVVEDLHDPQPPRVGVDLHADAAEAARVVEFAQFLGGEVVREGVVEAGHGARDRGVGELRFADGAVVLAVDPRQRFVDHARAAVGDERALHEPGQVFGVPAPPDARGHQREQQHHDRGERGGERRGQGVRRGVTSVQRLR